MNKKKMFKEAYAPPEPLHKEEFLRHAPIQPVSTTDFILSQIRYIRRWVWGLDIVLLCLSLIGTFFLQWKMLYELSAMMPLLALTMITESGRSEYYNMAEFEQSARFSLKSVVLARLGILGIMNIFLFLCFTLVSNVSVDISLIRTGIYLLCPYLITVFLCLWISRRFRAEEVFYLCIGVTVMVCLSVLMLHNFATAVYGGEYFVWWLGAALLSGIGATRECVRIIKQMEEFVWN